jgi:hypothetical protein
MDLPSFLVSEEIISIQAMGLAVTDLAVTGSEAMDLEGTDLEGTDLEGTDLEGTDLEGTEGGTIGEHSSRPKKAGFPVPHCMRPAAAAAGEIKQDRRKVAISGPAAQLNKIA